MITAMDTYDVRFPTSRELAGSDAMNPGPDYSLAYVVLRTGTPGLEGHGFCFTIGRGNEIAVAAIRALEPFVVGAHPQADLGGFAQRLTHDSPLRWLGPEKGVVHMAAAAVINAAFDLAAKAQDKPLWRFLADLTPEETVALVDWRYLADALTKDEALQMLRDAAPGRARRMAEIEAGGYPAYNTSVGWLGYSDDRVADLLRHALADGFTQVKLKVGGDLDADVRRMGLAREIAGDTVRIAVDANQAWDVPGAIKAIKALSPFDPWWVEEPTSPDDVVGHAAIRRAVSPVRIAAGEHVANRIIFKQLLQERAIDFLQADACRVAGVPENIAVLLLAAKYGVPVCPHAGGVGLCELVQHLAMYDYVAVSGSQHDRAIEWIDHLHEHFSAPAVVRNGRYLAPDRPGFSGELKPESLASFRYPDGPAWRQPNDT